MTKVTEDIAAKLQAALDAGLSDDCMKYIRKQVQDACCSIDDDIQYRIKEGLAQSLTAYVEDMASRTITAILDGNEGEMRRYLGCEHAGWTGRCGDTSGIGNVPDEQRHHVAHGRIFEYGAMELRAKIVEAFPDLLKNERILDMESQLKSLLAQLNREVEARRRVTEELRSYQ